MILYLSSTQHTNLLDFTGWYNVDSEMPIKKMVGNFVLKQFVIYDMRNFSHVTEVVLDRIAFGDSDEEFAEAIEEFLTMYNSRISVICEGLLQDSPLFCSLLESGVGNIICSTDIAEIQCEILECLSEKGMVRYSAKECTAKADSRKNYHFNCENVHVAVLSSQPRMGATTTAIGLCAWLAAMGASVCYVEENESGILTTMAAAYEMEQIGEGWQLDGVRYSTILTSEPANFIVHDFGYQINWNETANEAELLLIICGTKPYELPYSMRLLKWLDTVDAYVLCPFTHEAVRSDYAAILQSDYHKVLFLDYQPEPTDGMSNAKQYKMMMKKYIAGA